MMKSKKQSITRLKSRFYIRLLQALALCGFGFLSSCIKNGGDDQIVALYGVTPGDGSVRFYGSVKSADSLKAIPGLTVRLVSSDGWDSLQTTTNTQGQYLLYYYTYEGDILKLKVFDKDSTLNGGYFKDKLVNVTVSGRDVNNMEHNTDVLLQKK
jgi:hypothetical protein